MATLEEVYHLPLRATEGLLRSIFQLMGVALPVPDYTTLSRRRRGLSVVLPRQRQDQAIHIVVDSTGMKVFGEGEWKVRQHGYSKRRTWRKLHLGVDEASGEIVAAVATTHDVAGNEVIEGPLDQVEGEIEQVSGDGSYDKRNCYQAIKKRNAKAAIPPPPGRQDLAARQQPPGAAESRRESSTHPTGRADAVEERGQVSSAESGGNRGVQAQDDIRR
jgi:hypothetical protein